MADFVHNRDFSLAALVGRGLLHYRRTHAGVVAGVALATGILTGALMVGDAVRGSLLRRVDLRLGDTSVAIGSGEHFVSSDLPLRLKAELGADAAGVIAVRAVATEPDHGLRANRVDVYGVDETFWTIAARAERGPYQAAGVVLSRRLAEHLGVGVGETVILRLDRPGRMHRDMALASTDNASVLRLTVQGVLGDEEGGLFSLRAEQAVPMNAFVDRAVLAEALDLPGSVNLLLVGGRDLVSADTAAGVLHQVWRAQDAGLSLRKLKHDEWELQSRRIFMEDRVIAAAQLALPGARPVFTYLVNEIRREDRATPYSFVAAPGAPLVPKGMPDDGIVLNRWLADDLGAAVGDEVSVRYFVMGAGRGLSETSRVFRVYAITPMAGRALDRTLMPDFPGLADVDNCGDWESGLPIDLDQVREKDEAYWDDFGGTPKAFVTLAAAQAMWRNRYGTATAVRVSPSDESAETILDRVVDRLTPGDCGIRTIPVREMGMCAGREGVDFGQLFLGLSFFIIVAALVLTGMLFAFGVEQRAAETGLLMALGWPRGMVWRARLLEGACLVLPGALLGVGLGVAYSALILQGLQSIWEGAVGSAMLGLQVRASTLVGGAVVGAVAAWVAMWLTLRRQLRRSPVEVQGGGVAHPARRFAVGALVVGACCWGGVVLLAVRVSPGGGSEVAGAFFVAGALALLGCLAIIRGLFGMPIRRDRTRAVSLVAGGIRAVAQRPWHALGTVAVLAAGTFLVIATGANRSGAVTDPGRSGGTGGFTFYAESALPLLQPLKAPAPNAVLSVRVSAGDDASCLNLNRVQRPPVWGVDVALLQARGAFAFAAWAEGTDPSLRWDILNRPLPDGAIPAVADQGVILWGLGKDVGDELVIRDGRGNERRLRLVAGLQNSVFQGKILVSEANFLELFPGEPGYRAFLIENDSPAMDAARIELSRAFRDVGLDVRTAVAHLESFSVVQNTYLAIFLHLGAFGLLLGSGGMGVLVARHVLARRSELAMLRAVGFSRRAVRAYVLAEHGVILALGLLSGGAAGLVAVWPALLARGVDISLVELLLLVAGLVLNGMIWMLAAVMVAIRGNLVAALRRE